METTFDLTQIEEAQWIYSDMYKDAYGFRPRIDTSSWTMQDFDAEFDRLQSEIERAELARENAQKVAIKKFEDLVSNLINVGARDRATAIRWIDDSNGTNGDMGYLCYLMGVPFGYIQK